MHRLLFSCPGCLHAIHPVCYIEQAKLRFPVFYQAFPEDVLCLLNSPFSPARQLLSRQQRSEPRFRFVLGWNQIDKPLKTSAGIRPLVITQFTLNSPCRLRSVHLCIHLLEVTPPPRLLYLKDWPRHGCVEPLRAIQRKRKAGFLQSDKEEKEETSNGNVSRACQFALNALVHAYSAVFPLCILNLLLPNLCHICRNMKSFFVSVHRVSLP